MTETTSVLGPKVDKVLRRQKKVHLLSALMLVIISGAITVLTAIGNGPFDDGAPEWMGILFVALLTVPASVIVLSGSLFASELEDATAKPYVGPKQSAFTLRVPSKLEQRSDSHAIIPVIVLAVTIVLAGLFGPVLGGAVLSSDASFGVFTAVMAGVAALVIGVAIWTVRRGVIDAKRKRIFRSEFLTALSGAGFSWGKENILVQPMDYVNGLHAPLKDSSDAVSKWSIKWSGDVATLTPVTSEG